MKTTIIKSQLRSPRHAYRWHAAKRLLPTSPNLQSQIILKNAPRSGIAVKRRPGERGHQDIQIRNPKSEIISSSASHSQPARTYLSQMVTEFPGSDLRSLGKSIMLT